MNNRDQSALKGATAAIPPRGALFECAFSGSSPDILNLNFRHVLTIPKGDFNAN